MFCLRHLLCLHYGELILQRYSNTWNSMSSATCLDCRECVVFKFLRLAVDMAD